MCPLGWGCLGGVCSELLDAGPTLLGDGVACERDSQCESMLCLPSDRGGVCSRACTDPLSCASAVRFGAGCGPVTHGGEVGTYCLPQRVGGALSGEPCSAHSDCQSASCIAGACIEACDEDRDCVLGMQCGTLAYEAGSFSGCRFPAGPLYEVALPSTVLRAGFGNTAQRIALPADVASVTLQCLTTAGDPLPIGFNTVTQTVAGSALVHFDLAGLYDWVDQPNRWLPSDGYDVIAMGLPGSTPDRVQLRPGSLRVNVLAFSRTEGDTGSATLEPRALVRRGVDPGTGVLDVAIHLVGVGVTASEAPSNTRVSAMLSRFDTILSAVGIRRGATSYHDVSASTLSVIDSAEGPDSELAQLFRLSAARSGRVLSLFLVRSIDAGGDGFNTLGIAGGIPGPIGVHGTMHSGVVVAFDPSVAGAGGLAGHIAAHEGGHYLGLFHVTERIRPCTGSETPTTATCMPFGGGDTLSDTTRGDTTNLMHWSLIGSGSNTGLSSGQGHVLRHSNLVGWP